MRRTVQDHRAAGCYTLVCGTALSRVCLKFNQRMAALWPAVEATYSTD